MQPFVSAVRLPALRDVSLAAQLSDGGNGGPQLASLVVRAGPSDLSAYAAGLSLSQLDIAMPRVDRPIRGSAEGSFAGAPLRISATIGAPGALLGGYQVAGPMPIDVSAVIAGATFVARGAISDPVRLTGADVAVSAGCPIWTRSRPSRPDAAALQGDRVPGEVADRDGDSLAASPCAT